MGEVTQTFEAEFAAYLKIKHAFAVSNGTTALHLAYAALGLGPGDEIILPSLTFVATANAALYTGATPVFADISSLDDLTISPEAIESKITPRTKAIGVMHYGGYPCVMDQILDIAGRHHLAVVEDAAHAPGAMFQGRKCGTLSDVGCFSFFSNKNLTSGEGGMVVTQRDDLAERIRLMRSHGMTTLTWDRHLGHAYSYDVVELGYNYRTDEIHAALGLAQLAKLEHNNARRATLVAEYRRRLAETTGLKLPFTSRREGSAFHIMPIFLDEKVERAAFIDAMKAKGVQTSIHYPPIHTFTYYRNRFGDHAGSLPNTERAGQREVTLPLYPTMSPADNDWVIQAVHETLGRL
jgi:dTDP-4-amino-4,6-dideoxygalactose transaminase